MEKMMRQLAYAAAAVLLLGATLRSADALESR